MTTASHEHDAGHDPDAGVSWAMLGNCTIDRWLRQWSAIGDAILQRAAD